MESHFRVLLLESDADTRNSLAAVLELYGLGVTKTQEFGEALEAADKVHPRAVILEFGTPVRSGIELIRELRGRQWAGNLCIVVVSAWCDATHRLRASNAGCDHFLAKPADIQELLAVLQRAGQGPSASRPQPT
jgi:DNA-binding response OmpR family regulator